MTWPVVALDDVAAMEPRAITDGPFGSNLASRHYTDAGPRVVRLQNIGDGRFVDARAHISREHFDSLRAHEVQAGDLLVASLGEVLPRACLAPDWLGPAIVKADCIRVRLGDGVNPRWVLYALQRPDVRRWADDHRHGVGRPRLGLKTIRAIPIPLPPLDEQHRIVDLLEDHLSRLDAANRTVTDSIKRIDRLRDAALAKAVVDARHDPTTRVLRLGDLAHVSTGTTPLRGNTAFYANGTVPWITSGDLHQGLISRASQFVTPFALTETSLKLVPAGSLLIAMYGEGRTRGTVAELAIEATTNQACASVELHEPGLRPWVRLVLDADYNSMRRMAAGGVQPNLNLSLVRSIEVPVPTLAAQKTAIAHVCEVNAARKQLAMSLRSATKRGENLRRSLLAAAFSGRLTGTSSGLPGADLIDGLVGV